MADDQQTIPIEQKSLSQIDRYWLAAFAVAYGLLHHQGVVLAGLGDVGSTETRWADWLDLATPILVLGAAAGALHSLGSRRTQWALFALGVISYTEGHGIHLAANSIANARQSDVAHLWDEVVGHYVWYAGVALVVAALAWTAAGTTGPAPRVLSALLMVLVGATYATNALEGGTAPLALVSSAAFIWWGVAKRDTATGLLAPTFGLSFVMVAAYGGWHGGFPEPSSVGWSLF